MPCSLKHENALRRGGFATVAGIDEAGRGPLAGPVFAAAVVLPPRFRHKRLNDSKKLPADVREAIYGELVASEKVMWASASADVEEIDRLNILRAAHLAMRRAVEKLAVQADMALVDGLPVSGLPIPHRSLVGGDGISFSIAAASVIAKVERDRLMIELAAQFPDYGFEQHKGYGTPMHRERLEKHGPCPLHRRSFEPVAQLRLPLGKNVA